MPPLPCLLWFRTLAIWGCVAPPAPPAAAWSSTVRPSRPVRGAPGPVRRSGPRLGPASARAARCVAGTGTSRRRSRPRDSFAGLFRSPSPEWPDRRALNRRTIGADGDGYPRQTHRRKGRGMNEITPCRTPQRNHEIGTGVASDVIGYPITSLATPALRLLRGAFPVIGLRHSGCCSSAEGRWRCCVRFMYMNRLACLPSI